MFGIFQIQEVKIEITNNIQTIKFLDYEYRLFESQYIFMYNDDPKNTVKIIYEDHQVLNPI